MSPHREASVRIQPKPEGRGLFSERVFLPGDTILVAEGVIHDAPSLGSLQVGPDEHLAVPEGAAEAAHPWRFLEHACRPNAAFKGRRLVALGRIEPGDELTFDYETTEWELASPFGCACASMGCLGREIRGFRHLSHEERMRRLPQLRDDLRRLALDSHAAPPTAP
jgi:hypothetical protein